VLSDRIQKGAEKAGDMTGAFRRMGANGKTAGRQQQKNRERMKYT
jgi:hypothetical protein